MFSTSIAAAAAASLVAALNPRFPPPHAAPTHPPLLLPLLQLQLLSRYRLLSRRYVETGEINDISDSVEKVCMITTSTPAIAIATEPRQLSLASTISHVISHCTLAAFSAAHVAFSAAPLLRYLFTLPFFSFLGVPEHQ